MGQEYACLLHATDQGTVFVVKAIGGTSRACVATYLCASCTSSTITHKRP